MRPASSITGGTALPRPQAGDPASEPCLALRRLLELVDAQEGLAGLRDALAPDAPSRPLIDAVFAASPYLASLALRHPEDLQDILTREPETIHAETLHAIASAGSSATSQAQAMALFRRAKEKLALLTALSDLGQRWDVEEATRRMSDAADAFCAASVRFLLRQAAGKSAFRPANPQAPEENSGLIVLGMGKFGGRELNYSSDIDLIVFYDREIAPVASGVEPGGFFVRLTRDLVHLLQERTAEGYVYRVDLRLRPDPGSTQVAISTAAAFHYYETFGQNWERAAFIKARPVAGDLHAGQKFLRSLAPYIWRKYLDYNAISDIHAMKRQIHAAKGHAQIAVAGHNLKLGRGGIREIEFFVQSQQLIAGGRQPSLRTSQTLEALTRLRALDWIDAAAEEEMAQAYCFLRRIEHRLQMVADEQTHTLPARREDLEKFARFAGYDGLAAFERDLRHHLSRVQSHYAALFENTPELTAQKFSGNLVFTGDVDDPATVETLRGLGFRNPSGVVAAVKGWHFGRVRAVRTPQARERLTEFTPALLEALGETADPDLALTNFDKFLSDLPGGLQLFSLLRANPDLLRLLAKIMGSAPRLARILSRRRHLLDGILDPPVMDEESDVEALRAFLRREQEAASSYEEWLDRARVAGQEQAFVIGVRLLSQSISAEQAGRAYTRLASALIEAMHESVAADLRRRAGGIEIGKAAIIGMGKLGGQEMTSASDLDLIVVYDANGAPEVARNAPQFYARFTQRLIAALSAQTSQGALYEVDMRLRPSGKAGPVAVSAEGFLKYQQTQAWTWEHLALTRARVISGPPSLRDRLEADIRQVLTTSRDRAKIAADVRSMRDLTLKEKDKGDPWDLKNVRGGLLDVEFIAQFLQVAHAADAPEILNPNTVSALRNLKAAGLLEAGAAERLIEAAQLYQCVMQVLRLCTDGRFNPGTASAGLKDLLAQTVHMPDFGHLEHEIRSSCADVAALLDRIIV